MRLKYPSYYAFLVLLSVPLSISASDLDPDSLEYFESKIRPLLVENCYKCHSVDSDRIKGGFLIDSKPGLLKGGESGPAIIPGDARNSRLIQMVERHPDFEAMPPKSKLSQSEIASLITWIDRGAPDPRLEETVAADSLSDFNLEERKQWWSLQPVKKPPVPRVENQSWPANEYDHFLLAKLEEKGLAPAAPAERRELIRRLSFDLIGLAPTPNEVEAFLNDKSEEAYAKQVDRLLSSPHFGEKWARHWLDLVRYAETKSFEADYTMPYAYRYRDYVIRALNDDVPYDQFVLESLAGDLLPHPRFNPETGENESVKGPGYIYLTDGQHGPPDIHEDEARIFDGMIDATSKAFLGSTLACARCHDHKFDAITTGDYYSFYGMLRSSRLSYTNTVPVNQQNGPEKRLIQLKPRISYLALEDSLQDVELIPDYLSATRKLLDDPSVQEALRDFIASKERENKNQEGRAMENLEASLEKLVTPEAIKLGLEADLLVNWVRLALIPESGDEWPELEPIIPSANPARDKASENGNLSKSFASVAGSLDEWKLQGGAFAKPGSSKGGIILNMEGTNAIQTIIGNAVVGGLFAPRIDGAIRSPDFILDGKPIEFQAKGRNGAARLVVRNYELTGRGPTTSRIYQAIDSDHWQTVHFETYLWKGEPAYLEVLQNGVATHSLHPREGQPSPPDDNAYVAVRFDQAPDWKAYWQPQLDIPNQEARDSAITNRLKSIIGNMKSMPSNDDDTEVLGALFSAGFIKADTGRGLPLQKAMAEYRSIALEIPAPRYVRSLVDGDQHDQPVYIRGNHNNPSKDDNPRRFLDGLGGSAFAGPGSGRLEWAERVADPTNPLTARVRANRLWKHLFGNGIVATTNDFGKMGTKPTHPGLLAYLARDLIENGWSLKYMVRKMVLSQAYRMSSAPSQHAMDEDPDNKLLQHMPVKRLEAEAIRDHILACSGEIDTSMYGPSVSAYVRDLPDSRAKPASGPLDGNGRRSIYIEMRRNFLPTFLRAFDMPNATESIGRRQVTNVPAQSLALMNDPFVHEQAKAWAKRVLYSKHNLEQRIHEIHQTAFCRPASASEIQWAKRFLDTLADEYGSSLDDLAVWTDLCHTIYNRKEFIYVF
ncbi:MAG: PSD1 and planctomycete cytochrome C domain-containing protein [Verrucomicrobiota bacterium]|nr:PSD1 and planctomycete cytochrome C domain-containing protein [Verrucomicrobiota bacterium]